MSEDEKKTIEAFKYWAETNTEKGVCSIPDNICKNIIDLIEKQQKALKNSVLKEAIREKIKKLEKYIYTGKNAPQDFLQYRVKAQIRILEEILGE